jgi:hypothetical protein
VDPIMMLWLTGCVVIAGAVGVTGGAELPPPLHPPNKTICNDRAAAAIRAVCLRQRSRLNTVATCCVKEAPLRIDDGV